MYYTAFATYLCNIVLVGNEEGLQVLHIESDADKRKFDIDPEWIENEDFFENEITQVVEFLTGRRKTFDLRLNPQGTEFQKTVWDALLTIPYGETATYGEIAAQIGRPKASRAVGAANGRNPIPLIIPCHRVIGSNGKLTGFAFGLELKRELLEMERMGLIE